MVQALHETREGTTAVCRHHWIIDSAVGPVSKGRCRTCGVEKEFRNYIETVPWGEDTTLSYLVSSRIPISVVSTDDGEE